MTNYTLDKDKYKAAFLYIANSIGKVEGMKKAYKLLYFLDFDFYEAYEKPFTGEIYKSLQMGPVPVYFSGIIEELEKEGKIRTKKVRMSPAHDNDTIVYEPVSIENYAFSKQEKKMLDRIIRIYGNQTGKSLEKISHAEAPYNAVGLYQVIPYEYSLYSDTPDLTS